MIQYIEGKMLRDMFVSGANNLQNHQNTLSQQLVLPANDSPL